MNRAFPNPWNAYFPPFVSYANSTNHGHLGAEYWNVAQSVVRGDGYSSPFGMESGPTAWVPPATVLLLALIHRLDGYSEMVTIRVYVTLNAMVFGFVAWQISGYVLSQFYPLPHSKPQTILRYLNRVILLSIANVFVASFYDKF